jgi:hypothetical protein
MATGLRAGEVEGNGGALDGPFYFDVELLGEFVEGTGSRSMNE